MVVIGDVVGESRDLRLSARIRQSSGAQADQCRGRAADRYA
jgi:hypothetical protein